MSRRYYLAPATGSVHNAENVEPNYSAVIGSTFVPCVVLDLEDPAGLLATLRDARSHMLKGGPNYGRLGGLIAEIESQTRPPKPAEPTGLGAVVEDVGGSLWVRAPKDGNSVQTEWVSSHSTAQFWDSIDAVRVLSEGVTQP